jgi:hypothetical protein
MPVRSDQFRAVLPTTPTLAHLRLMVKRILRKYKYPPDQQDATVELVLQQAEVLGESWG